MNLELEICEKLNMGKRVPKNNGRNPFLEDGDRRTCGWIGVDLDGTLAKSVKSRAAEDIGVPIYPMVKQVKKWLAEGHEVRIFTSRVNPYHRRIEALRARRAIEAWSKRYLGQVLPITHEKDWDMALLFDDRARQVEQNTGRIVSSFSSKNLGAHRTEFEESSPSSYFRRASSSRKMWIAEIA